MVDTLCDNLGRPYVAVETDEFGSVSYLREDGDYDIPLDLPVEVISELALEAHRRDMKLNDLMIEIITRAVGRVEVADGAV